jgi:hypothetical protein
VAGQPATWPAEGPPDRRDEIEMLGRPLGIRCRPTYRCGWRGSKSIRRRFLIIFASGGCIRFIGKNDTFQDQ